MNLPPREDTFVGFGATRAQIWQGPQSRSLAEWFRGTGLETEHARLARVAWRRREGARLVRRAADAKFPFAMVRLGDLYAEGIGVLKDQTQALRRYGEAVETEEDTKIGTAARCTLALHYKGGQVITRDLAQAARWFEQAAQEGCPTSMMNLAEMHAKGEGRPKDDAKAREWHAKARETYLKYAEQGTTSAMSDVARMYSEGL
jgi:hypothetical protein